MAKAVLISIRPEWVEKILGGEKTIEVRKTRPKLETPFKCYIYETQRKSDTPWIDEDGHMIFRGRGKVVAEFTCTGIDKIEPANEPYGTYDIDDDYVLKTCLGNGAMWDYGNGQTLYGWNISEAFSRLPTGCRCLNRRRRNCLDNLANQNGRISTGYHREARTGCDSIPGCDFIPVSREFEHRTSRWHFQMSVGR